MAKVLAHPAINRARSARSTRDAVDPAIPPKPVCGAPEGIGDPLAAGDLDDEACELADEFLGALSFTRPRTTELFVGDVAGAVLRFGIDRLGALIEGRVSAGRDSPPNGGDELEPDGDVSAGTDRPLTGSDRPVDGLVALPGDDVPDPLDTGDAAGITLGSAMLVPGKVGMAISGTPMSPKGMKGSASGALALEGVPPPDGFPVVGTVGTAADGALRRRSRIGSETPAPIDTRGSGAPTWVIAPLPADGVTASTGAVSVGAAAATAAPTGGRAMTLRSKLTGPASEMALPTKLTPAPSDTEWSERIVPTRDVRAARLVAPPTCHSTSLGLTPSPRTIWAPTAERRFDGI
jgi:hypothetical protein